MCQVKEFNVSLCVFLGGGVHVRCQCACFGGGGGGGGGVYDFNVPEGGV